VDGADAAEEVGLGRILPKSCWEILARGVLDSAISSSLLPSLSSSLISP
jgi:hypothetical protein